MLGSSQPKSRSSPPEAQQAPQKAPQTFRIRPESLPPWTHSILKSLLRQTRPTIRRYSTKLISLWAAPKRLRGTDTAMDTEVTRSLNLQTTLSLANPYLHLSTTIPALATILLTLHINNSQHRDQVQAWQDNRAIKGNIKTRTDNNLHRTRAVWSLKLA